jgi:N-acetylneuraminic acid mutarotase
MALVGAFIRTWPAEANTSLSWRNLPELPRALGGQFAGMAGEELLVAGGSYFDTPPWSGGVKQRVDTVFGLGRSAEQWRVVGKLPQAITSGAGVSTPRGLLCIGGQLNEGSSRQCLMLSMQDGKLSTQAYPDLPATLSMHAAACAGETVYVAGGQTSTQSTSAQRTFLSLRLGDSTWQQLPDLPEAGRILPVLIASGGDVFLISGAELTGDAGPPAGRRFLADAHRYSKESGWKRLAPPPRPVQAAPGLVWNGTLLVVFGGNDGTYAKREFEVREHHPGFSKEVLAYDIPANRWSVAGQLPVSLATTAVALRGGEFVIPGGEDRPAHRSDSVLACRLR